MSSPSLDFITWKPEYDCPVKLINCQHQEVLLFLNAWYVDLRLGRYKKSDLLAFLKHRFAFLTHYSDFHLAFEEDMLVLLTRRYGFPEALYREHLAAHAAFNTQFLSSLKAQIERFAGANAVLLADTILIDVLKDVAGWWYTHIRSPQEDKPAGPDHVYRDFMAAMPPQALQNLFNDLLAAAELNI